MSEPFGVYLHIPFCVSKCDYCAFATWTDRHHLIEAYLAALTTDIARAVDGWDAAGDEHLRRRRHAHARTGCRAGRGAASRPGRWRRRDHGRVQPRRRHRRAAHRVRRGRRQSSQHRCAVDGRPRARLTRTVARPEQRRDGGGGRPIGGVADVQRRCDLRRGGRAAVRLGGDGGVDPDLRPAARVGLRAARSRPARHSPPNPTGIPTTTTRPTSTSSSTSPSPRPDSRTTRCRTGRAPGTSAGTTSSTGASRTTPASAVRRTRTGRAGGGGTCARPTATSSSSSEPADRGVRGDARRRDPTDRGAAAGAADARRRPRRRPRRRRARRPGRPDRRPVGVDPIRPPARQRDLPPPPLT